MKIDKQSEIYFVGVENEVQLFSLKILLSVWINFNSKSIVYKKFFTIQKF